MTQAILNPVTVVNTSDAPIPVVISAVAAAVNAQTGTTYTVLATDWGKLLTFSNGSAVAVTLPQANSTTFANGWWVSVVNLGVGAATITPTTSTIQGAATLVLATGEGATIYSDGTNYFYQAGTSAADATVLKTTGSQTITGVKTFSANPVFTVGNSIKSNVAAATLSSNAATVTSYFTQITTESLTTAAGASQALVITLTGAAATDIAILTKAGGTNTRKNYQLEAVMTSNTCTVTLYNTEPINAINGTVIFNLWILKA